MGSTFSAKVAADLISYARTQGADGDQLEAMLRLPPGWSSRQDIRIPAATMASMWKRAIDGAGDPDLAFHMAVERMFNADRTTKLIMEASATVREAFEQAAQYSVLIADALAVEIGERGDIVYIEFSSRPDWQGQPPDVVKDCINISMVSAALAVQRLIGQRCPPALLSFAFASPDNAAEYYRVYDCSIEFGSEHNRIGFRTEVAEQPVSSEDAGLKAALRRYADELKANFAHHGPFSDTVRAVILDKMDPFPPTLPTVASALAASDRSVQRRLKEEELTFKGLVEDVRMELAQRHLTTSDRSIDEVAYLSGYADTSSFVRAFKRRHGTPPRQFATARSRTP